MSGRGVDRPPRYAGPVRDVEAGVRTLLIKLKRENPLAVHHRIRRRLGAVGVVVLWADGAVIGRLLYKSPRNLGGNHRGPTRISSAFRAPLKGGQSLGTI